MTKWPWTQEVYPRVAALRDAIDAVVSLRVAAYDNEKGAYEAYEPAVLALADVLLRLDPRTAAPVVGCCELKPGPYCPSCGHKHVPSSCPYGA